MRSGRVARVGARWAKESAVSARALSSFLYSYVRPRPQVRERWPGRIDLQATSRIAVFSHFDRRGRVQDFVHYYLRQIHDAGYAIVFVSAAPQLDPAAIEQLTPICGLILRRDNVGWDFGAYKAGIEVITNLDRLDSLLLANDSVYGPVHDLGALIGRMNPAEADVWGITDSWERRFHLQSFFLLFGKTAVAN